MPVLLVRPGQAGADAADAGPPAHILVPVDGSPVAERIIEPAIAVARVTGARMTLMRVVSPGAIAPHPGIGLLALEATVERGSVEAHEYLDRLAEAVRAAGVPAATRVIVAARPAGAIVDDATRIGADLIAMATHGRGGIPRLALGSVADEVLRGGHTPLLLQRPAPVARERGRRGAGMLTLVR